MSVIPAPPPVRPADNSCTKWGLIGCAVLGGIGVLLVSIGFYALSRSPIFKQAMAAGVQAEYAKKQLKVVGRAVDNYVADQKKYPSELKDLIPKYLPNDASLRIGRDASSPRIWYKKPSMDAGGETVMLQTEIQPPIGPPTVNNAPPWIIKLHKDGTLEGMTYEYTDKFGNTQRMPIANQ